MFTGSHDKVTRITPTKHSLIQGQRFWSTHLNLAVSVLANVLTRVYHIAQNSGGGKLGQINHFRVLGGKRWRI